MLGLFSQMLFSNKVAHKDSETTQALHDSLINIISSSIYHRNVRILALEIFKLLISCLVNSPFNLVFNLLGLILILINFKYELKISLFLLVLLSLLNLFFTQTISYNEFDFLVNCLLKITRLSFLNLPSHLTRCQTFQKLFVVSKVKVFG